jgi:hypothetical protein
MHELAVIGTKAKTSTVVRAAAHAELSLDRSRYDYGSRLDLQPPRDIPRRYRSAGTVPDLD